jgi:hypothetical protein
MNLDFASGKSGEIGNTHLTLAVLAVCAVVLGTAVVAMIVSHRWRRVIPRVTAGLVCGLVAAYLVARGVAEFWIVDYADPESYRNAWGGPSLIGVFAVHSGPGLAVIVAAALWLRRRVSRRTGQVEKS